MCTRVVRADIALLNGVSAALARLRELYARWSLGGGIVAEPKSIN